MMMMMTMTKMIIAVFAFLAITPPNKPDELELNNQFPMQQQFKSIFKDQENTVLAKRLQQPVELRKIMNQQLNQLKEIHNQNPTSY